MMNSCEKCNGRKSCVGPVTIGVALGLTFAFCVFFMTAWSMWFGLPDSLSAHMMHAAPTSWSEAGVIAVWAFLKGLLGGFVFAVFYNLICCCKSKCCGKCSCCSGNGNSSKK